MTIAIIHAPELMPRCFPFLWSTTHPLQPPRATRSHGAARCRLGHGVERHALDVTHESLGHTAQPPAMAERCDENRQIS
jgi:hypothetical protein